MDFSRLTRAPPSLTCDVIDYHGNSGVTDVAGDETPETLLASRVPKLQAHLGEPIKAPEIQQVDKEKRGGREEAVREDGREQTDEGRCEVEAGEGEGVRLPKYLLVMSYTTTAAAESRM